MPHIPVYNGCENPADIGQTNLTPKTIADNSIFRFFTRLISMLTGAYGLVMTLLLLVRSLVGESWMLVALFNSFVHVLLLPALVLLPVCLLLRRWRLALLLMSPAAAFVILYGIFFTERTPDVPPDAPKFSLLTFNMHAESLHLDPMVAIIREADADIIALQELSVSAAERFTLEFGDVYPYRALHPTESSFLGQGVMSRYPITADVYWHIYLGHQRVALDMNGTTLTLYNTHPVHPFVDGFNTELRYEEVGEVLAQAADDSGAVILAGDFNTTDQSDDYRRITALYTDSFREAGSGFGFTFPDFGHANSIPKRIPVRYLPLPRLSRLDYVFHNEHLRAVEAQVWPTSGGSDHRPFRVQLALVSPSQ